MESRNRALLQRITTRYSIGPLISKEVDDYIKFRLNVAGCDKPLFNAGAVRQVVSFSNCYPRLINVICDHALLTAFVRGKKKIDARMVKECAADLSISAEKPVDDGWESRPTTLFSMAAHPWRRPWVGIPLVFLLVVLLAGLAGLFYFKGGWRPQQPPMAVIESTAGDRADILVEPSSEGAPAPATSQGLTGAATASGPVRPPAKHEDVPAAATTLTPDGAASLSAPEIEAHLDRTFTIRFQMDSNEFSDDAYDLMNRLAKVAKQAPDIRVSVSGYTDSLGNYDYNRRLSEFRANVVKSYMVGQGVAPAQVRTFGLGPENPLESNETREGRAANRRVEIVLQRSGAD